MDEEIASLSELVTRWSLVRIAHGPLQANAIDARRAMLLNYRLAIQRYARTLMPGEPSADDLAQEVFLKLMKGDFKEAAPERGRFRDFLKTAVRNLMRAEWRRQKQFQHFLETSIEPQQDQSLEPVTWQQSCRDVLLDGTWNRLQSEAALAFRVLQLRSTYPDATSDELADRLSQSIGRSCTAEAWRQLLHRSRQRFTQLLIEEAASRLIDRSREEIQQELIELDLWELARPHLPDDWNISTPSH